MIQNRRFLNKTSEKRNNTIMSSSSRARETIVANMVTDQHISDIKEIKTRITEDPASTDNVTTVGKGSTGRLIVGLIRKRNNLTLTTSL